MSVTKRSITATISDAADGLSAAVHLGDESLVGLRMPAAWTAAVITFQCAPTETGTYQNLYDAYGSEISITVAASRNIVFPPDLIAMFAGLRWLKLRSGTSATPVQQGGARTLTLSARQV